MILRSLVKWTLYSLAMSPFLLLLGMALEQDRNEQILEAAGAALKSRWGRQDRDRSRLRAGAD